METPDGKASAEERDRLILARTAGIVSWIYAAERALVGLALLQARGGAGLYAPRVFGTLCLVHAALLVAAGGALFKDRRWAWGPAVLAAAGAIFFAVIEARQANWMNAAVDAAYAIVAAVVLFKRRHSA